MDEDNEICQKHTNLPEVTSAGLLLRVDCSHQIVEVLQDNNAECLSEFEVQGLKLSSLLSYSKITLPTRLDGME